MVQVLVIKSTSNEKIKHLKSLNQKKFREENQQFIVENLKIIYDSMKLDTGFESLFVTQDFIKKNQAKFDELIEDLKIEEYFLIDEKVNNYFSSLDTPSGICALYSMKKTEIDFESIVVYLNKINDPGNLGTIMRSALAFGIKNIVLDENCVDIYNSKTINSAKDAIFKLNIELDNNRKILGEIKKRMKIYSTRLEDSSGIEALKKHPGYAVGSAEARKKFCIVFGNEANGIDNGIYDMSDEFIKINMTSDIESINVASSAAIIFHYIYNNIK